MVIVGAKERTWRPTQYQGIELCGLRRNDDGGTIAIGGRRVTAGDSVWTPDGRHDVTAETEAVLFVSAPKGIKVLE